jgi:serine protease Do
MQGADRRAAAVVPIPLAPWNLKAAQPTLSPINAGIAGKTHTGADWTARLPGAWRRLIIQGGITHERAGKSLVGKALRFLAAALFVALAGPAAAQSTVDESARGIVRVVVILQTSEGRMLYGSGSGFVVAPNLVVTNAHVVSPARQRSEYELAVVPPEGDGLIPARIIRYSPLSELALLEFSGPNLPALTISTVEPSPGDGVIALGYPDVDYQGATGADLLRPAPASRTSGQISSLRDTAPTGEPIPSINHQAVISSGSSGGPLLDECGRVIGVNSWHVSGQDTRETRGVSTRAGQLLEFLDEAGVTPTLSDERCLSFAERIEAERAETISALQTQNEELAGKLETADRLTRIAVVVLIGGTLALFVAVCVLGAIVLSRRRNGHQDPEQPHSRPQPHVSTPEPFETPARRRVGVVAIVAGAAVAAVLIVSAGIALLRAQGATTAEIPEMPEFSGSIACALDRETSVGSQGVSDMSFTASGHLCVNERTLYAPLDGGPAYRRAIVLGEARVLDILTIDPSTGEFRRERYSLDNETFSAANQAVADSRVGRGCTGDPADVARRNDALMQFAQGEPRQRLVWRCEARN